MRASFDEYSKRYKNVRMRRDEDGILELALHTDGGPLVWGSGPHTDLGYCFADVAADPDNRVVILTGTGENFIASVDDSWLVDRMEPELWYEMYAHGKRLLLNLLDIEVPMIAAINGPAIVHAELGVMCDIVLAAETATFQDAPHFRNGVVPSDGVHLIWPHLLGMNRGRHFLLTGHRIEAQEALNIGLVAEVLPPEELHERAWAVAKKLARQPTATLRYTRQALTQVPKSLLNDHLSHGLALEGLGAWNHWPK